MSKFWPTYITLFGFLLSPRAWSLPDATLAARASVAAAQELLASPPLPELESSNGITFAPQVGLTSITTEGHKYFEATTSPPASAYTQDHTGKLSGPSGALAFNGTTRGRWAWFGFLVGSKLQGHVDAFNSSGTPTFSLNQISATSLAGVTGLSFKFYGESNSPFAAGAFLGPAYLNIQSVFTLVQHDISAPDQKIEMNPSIPAAYTGLQFKVRLNKFLVNPYALYMKDLGSKCKKLEVGSGSSPCADLDASFMGYGLYLGYGAFRVRVFSGVSPSANSDGLKISSYSVSYTFGLNGK